MSPRLYRRGFFLYIALATNFSRSRSTMNKLKKSLMLSLALSLGGLQSVSALPTSLIEVVWRVSEHTPNGHWFLEYGRHLGLIRLAVLDDVANAAVIDALDVCSRLIPENVTRNDVFASMDKCVQGVQPPQGIAHYYLAPVVPVVGGLLACLVYYCCFKLRQNRPHQHRA